jgi:hypothetical protein
MGDLRDSEETDSLIKDNADEEDELNIIIEEWKDESPLYERVISEIVDDSEGYTGDTKLDRILGRIGDISHGLQTGVVGSLIYYSDTVAFFNEYEDDIYDVIDNLCDNGLEPLEALKNNISEVDIIMGSDITKNWVVWTVYEEIAYKLGEELDSLRERYGGK